jgi:hypothetical protein
MEVGLLERMIRLDFPPFGSRRPKMHLRQGRITW